MNDDNANNQMQGLPNFWWAFVLQGVVAIIIGWLLLMQPARTTLVLVTFLGLYWLISGVAEIVFSLMDVTHKGSRWGLRLVGGLIGIIAGLFVLNNQILASVMTPVILMYIVSFVFIINGIINMIVGNEAHHEGSYEWSWGSFFLGALQLIIGLMLLGSPTLIATASLILAIAFVLIVNGIVGIIVGVKLRQVDSSESTQTSTSSKKRGRPKKNS